MKHLTKHRKLIIELLAGYFDDNYGLPPYSARTLQGMIEDMVKYQWNDYEVDKVPSIIQVHRTLRDLVKAGVIVGERVKEGWSYGNNSLPRWVMHYHLVEQVDRNRLTKETKEICQKAIRAKYGVKLFSDVPFDYGALPADVAIMKTKIKSLIQRTHPDKASGYDDLFIELKKALDLINSGIPLPTDKPPASSNGKASYAN